MYKSMKTILHTDGCANTVEHDIHPTKYSSLICMLPIPFGQFIMMVLLDPGKVTNGSAFRAALHFKDEKKNKTSN